MAGLVYSFEWRSNSRGNPRVVTAYESSTSEVEEKGCPVIVDNSDSDTNDDIRIVASAEGDAIFGFTDTDFEGAAGTEIGVIRPAPFDDIFSVTYSSGGANAAFDWGVIGSFGGWLLSTETDETTKVVFDAADVTTNVHFVIVGIDDRDTQINGAIGSAGARVLVQWTGRVTTTTPVDMQTA